MKILVCISHVPDTTTKVKFKDNNSSFDNAGVQWIINPWDELALTRALDLKDSLTGVIEEVNIITVGLLNSEPTIRKALAIGADKGIRVNMEPVDAYVVASQLAEVIRNESYDIVLCGIESSDYNGCNVGGMLSELLNMPSVSAVSSLEIVEGKVTLKREIDGGQEVVATQTPIIGIVQKGICKEPRIPAMRGIMTARTKPLQVIEPAMVDSLTEFVSYENPKAKAACKKIDPENVKELIQLLHNEAKVI